MFYNILEQIYTIMMETYQNCTEHTPLDIQRENIFPDRPEEAAMFGCKSLSV